MGKVSANRCRSTPANCLRPPSQMNWVLDGFKSKQFEAIQSGILHSSENHSFENESSENQSSENHISEIQKIIYFIVPKITCFENESSENHISERHKIRKMQSSKM